MVVSSTPPSPPPEDGVNNAAFAHAVFVFSKVRSGVHQALRCAISEYKYAERQEYSKRIHSPIKMQFHTADTEAGPDTALVITGFCGVDHIEDFIQKTFYEQSK